MENKELDAYIAEHVFKLHVQVGTIKKWEKGKVSQWDKPDPYSTDVTYAMQVVKAMGWYRLAHTTEGVHTATFADVKGNLFVAKADTLALAICEAAKKKIEGKATKRNQTRSSSFGLKQGV